MAIASSRGALLWMRKSSLLENSCNNFLSLKCKGRCRSRTKPRNQLSSYKTTRYILTRFNIRLGNRYTMTNFSKKERKIVREATSLTSLRKKTNRNKSLNINNSWMRLVRRKATPTLKNRTLSIGHPSRKKYNRRKISQTFPQEIKTKEIYASAIKNKPTIIHSTIPKKITKATLLDKIV